MDGWMDGAVIVFGGWAIRLGTVLDPPMWTLDGLATASRSTKYNQAMYKAVLV
jgi:hypothetical protein